jgi:hypothetical protein
MSMKRSKNPMCALKNPIDTEAEDSAASPILDPVVLAKIVALLQHAPTPKIEERGNPEKSAAEDRAILEELGQLRREANCELT